jgi:protein-tyrosine phosphatase
MRRKYDADLTWRHDWIGWPDFRLPEDHAAAVDRIRALHEQAAQETAEVACGAGIGRTGTVIACLAVLSGVPAAEAVEWTRKHHHPRAVETPGQRRWVANFPTEG